MGRHKQIIDLAAEGYTDKEIAASLAISIGTLNTYWMRLRARHQAQSRTEVVAKALRERICVLEQEVLEWQFLAKECPFFLWTAKPSGEIEFLNPWFEDFSGKPLGSFNGEGCRLMMPVDELDLSSRRWQEAQESGRGYEALVHFRNRSGAYEVHQLRLRPRVDSHGLVLRWLGSAFPVKLATS